MTKRPYKHPQFNLRLPQELKDQIEKASRNSGRSMNAEIVERLKKTFDESSISNKSEFIHRSEIEKLVHEIVNAKLTKK